MYQVGLGLSHQRRDGCVLHEEGQSAEVTAATLAGLRAAIWLRQSALERRQVREEMRAFDEQRVYAVAAAVSCDCPRL